MLKRELIESWNKLTFKRTMLMKCHWIIYKSNIDNPQGKKAAITNINFILIMAVLFYWPLSLFVQWLARYDRQISFVIRTPRFSPASALPSPSFSLPLFFSFVLLSLFRAPPSHPSVTLAILFFHFVLVFRFLDKHLCWQLSGSIFHPFRNILGKNYRRTVS